MNGETGPEMERVAAHERLEKLMQNRQVLNSVVDFMEGKE